MDTELFMSMTAGIPVRDEILRSRCWRAFAPETEGRLLASLVSRAVERPSFSFRTPSNDAAELRFQIEGGRLGVVAIVHHGEVEAAFPFLRGGFRHEMRIVEAGSRPSLGRGSVLARCGETTLSFYDVLHGAGLARYQPGERRWLVLNALALTLRRVRPLCLPVERDGELPFPTTGHRMCLRSSNGAPDEGIFQSCIEGDPQPTAFDGRSYVLAPLDLGGGKEQPFLVDLCVAPEMLEGLGTPLTRGEEVAGVFWLQGYAPEVLDSY